MLLPAPLLPTKAVILPPSTFKLISFTALSLVSSYLKLTLLKVTSQFISLRSGKCSSFFIKETVNNNVRGADSLLQEWAYKNDYFIMRVNNFSPTHLFVKEGTFAIPKTKNNANLLRAHLH